MKNNRIAPILIIILASGLLVSFYLYYDANQALSQLNLEKQSISEELSELREEYDEVTKGLENARISTENLEQHIRELEEQIKDPTSVPKPDIILNITRKGEVRNIIFLIGDGMGVGQISAAEIENGEETLAISSMPYKALVTTHSLSGHVTDSAAAGTALATGYKTKNGMISMTPGGEELLTIVEAAEDVGMSTGVVTDTRITHATPACFVTHVYNRNKEADIAEQILVSGVDVLMGGGSTYFDSTAPQLMGYNVVTNTTELEGFLSGKLLGLFAKSYMSYDSGRDPELEPSLLEMTEKAIQILSDDPEGFFLMVEGGRIDHTCHANDLNNTVRETLCFDLAVSEALKYASNCNDTLVIVTADHETGGLSIAGEYPSGEAWYNWISNDHTGNMVPVYAYGPRAEEVMTFTDNTDIGEFLLSLPS